MVILDFGLKNCPVIRQTAKDPGIFLSKNAVQNMYSHFPPFFYVDILLSISTVHFIVLEGTRIHGQSLITLLLLP